MTSRYPTLDSVLQQKLHTWKLSPTEKRSKLWDSCSYWGVVIVRAENSHQARQLAARAFCKDAVKALESLAESPWLSAALARCEIVYDPRFDAVDTAGVADPQSQ